MSGAVGEACAGVGGKGVWRGCHVGRRSCGFRRKCAGKDSFTRTECVEYGDARLEMSELGRHALENDTVQVVSEVKSQVQSRLEVEKKVVK